MNNNLSVTTTNQFSNLKSDPVAEWTEYLYSIDHLPYGNMFADWSLSDPPNPPTPANPLPDPQSAQFYVRYSDVYNATSLFDCIGHVASQHTGGFATATYSLTPRFLKQPDTPYGNGNWTGYHDLFNCKGSARAVGGSDYNHIETYPQFTVQGDNPDIVQVILNSNLLAVKANMAPSDVYAAVNKINTDFGLPLTPFPASSSISSFKIPGILEGWDVPKNKVNYSKLHAANSAAVAAMTTTEYDGDKNTFGNIFTFLLAVSSMIVLWKYMHR